MATIGETTRPAFAYDSATDTWIPVGVGPHAHTPAAIGAISNALVDAKGDLITATAADLPARLAVGANNAFLKADSTTASGLVWDNSAWTSYTPATVNLTVGNGTLVGRYKQIGKTVSWEVRFTLGSTSAISNDAFIEQPTAATSQGANALYVDSSAAGWFNGFWYGGYPRYQGTYGTLSATVPFTWATSDFQ